MVPGSAGTGWTLSERGFLHSLLLPPKYSDFSASLHFLVCKNRSPTTCDLQHHFSLELETQSIS